MASEMAEKDFIIEGFREIREDIRRLGDRIDSALRRCDDDCPDKFAAKGEMDKLQSYFRALILAMLNVAAARFL